MSRVDDLLAHVDRGPCGGWHWVGGDRRLRHAWSCAACVALGRLGLRRGRDFGRAAA